MIEVRNLTRNYGSFTAVDDVSFDIQPGEVVGLLGHNGAGKTTIMKMLTGFIEPSAGSVSVDGVDVLTAPLAVQAQMGYLPESLPLYPELTVMEYLDHAARMRGFEPADVVPEAIENTRLADKALEPIDTLSRGFKQRLGVAQAILHQPKFLILDEPSNGLDPNQIREMRRLIKTLSERATVILSTHIMQEVNAVCDRVLILRGGRLAVDERLEALKQASTARIETHPQADVPGALADLDGISDVSGTAGSWRIALSGTGGAEQAEEGVAHIAQRLVAARIPIHHLGLEVKDLEAVFAEVNEA